MCRNGQGPVVVDLLDELRLMIPLTLTDARTVGAGIQLLTYERTA